MNSKYPLVIFFLIILLVIGGGIFWTHREKTSAPVAGTTAVKEKTDEYIYDEAGVSFKFPKKWAIERDERTAPTVAEQKRTGELLLKDETSSFVFLINRPDPDLSVWDVKLASGTARIGDINLPANPSSEWVRFGSSHNELGGTEMIRASFDHKGNHFFILFTYPARNYEEAAKLFFAIIESFFFSA